MADWTANSNFGAMGRREPVVRAAREPAQPRSEAPRAERFAAIRPEEIEVPRAASAALAEYNAAQDGPLAKARLAVWVGGGLVSVALIAVTGIWGYKLVLREVMGLPVVVAESGPMRVAPADPEGEVVPQQGLAVNAIPAAGTAAPPSDVLMLAPQTPGLAEEDLEVVQTTAEADEVMPAAPLAAAPAAAPAEALATVAVATDAIPPAAEIVAAPVEAAPAPAEATPARLTAALLPADRPMTTDEVLAFADQIAGQSAPLAGVVAPVQAAAAAVAAVAAPPEAALEPAAPVEVAPTATVEATPVLASAAAPALRPQARPAAKPAPVAEPQPAEPDLAEAAPLEAAPAEAAPATDAAAVPVTASLPAGTNLVQLGAFDSAEIAASEWTRLQGAFGEFLGSKDRVIQETQSGGRTLYRLRATGFADRADARRLCAALTAEGADCIPVTVD